MVHRRMRNLIFGDRVTTQKLSLSNMRVKLRMKRNGLAFLMANHDGGVVGSAIWSLRGKY